MFISDTVVSAMSVATAAGAQPVRVWFGPWPVARSRGADQQIHINTNKLTLTITARITLIMTNIQNVHVGRQDIERHDEPVLDCLRIPTGLPGLPGLPGRQNTNDS